MPAAQTHTSKISAKTSSVAPKRAPQRQSRTEHADSASKTYITPRQKRYPPWQSLPFLILQEIFDYAAILDTSDRWRDRSWLSKTALVCRSFAEPAISILYQYPQTVPQARLRKLREAIQMNPTLGLMVRYVDTGYVYNIEKNGKVELLELLRMTPNLKELYISNRLDIQVIPKNVSYPRDLIQVLEKAGIRLKAWTWKADLSQELCQLYSDVIDESQEENAGLKPYKHNLQFLQALHQNSTCFRTLTSLTLDDFNTEALDFPSFWDATSKSKHATRRFESVAARGILALKYLKHLTIRRCDFCADGFLAQLSPMKLFTLELEACPVRSKALSAFLLDQGSELRVLKLIRCVALNLEFLSSLAAATPNLVQFEFDSNYKIDTDGNDSPVPHWVKWGDFSLLRESADGPSWPKSLQYLQMKSLSKWNPEECASFLESLLECGKEGQLRYLKELHVWCILHIGWRDRATFREQWNDAFEETFLGPESTAYLSRKKKRKSAAASAIKGTCSRVHIRIDDARPTGKQYVEDDFVEEEPIFSKHVRRQPATSQPRARNKTAMRHAADDEGDGEFQADDLAFADPDGEDSAWDVSD